MLFAIFPIVYLFSINTIETSFNDIIFPILISISVTVILLMISRLILKDWVRSGLIVSLLLVISFYYGHIYSLLDSSIIGELGIGRHRYLLPIFSLVFIVGTIFIVRTQIDLDKLKKIINVIAITLIVITIPNFVSTDGSVVKSINEIQFQNQEMSYDLKNLSILNTQEKVDVYYIILDGYASSERMKQDLLFDNYGFLSELESRGFFAPDISSSNYPSTGWSLTSSLNMNYLPVRNEIQTDAEYAFLIEEMNQKNEVMRNFDYLDYEIFYYRTYRVFAENPMFIDQIICQNDNPINSKFNNILLRTTILGFLSNQIKLESDRQTILCAFTEIPNLVDKTDKPIFAFMHMLIPHPPYLFGPNGENVIGDKTQTVEGSYVDKEKYIDSIKFTNKKILQVIDKIQHNNKNSIIIVQSDHGYDFEIDYENPSDLSLKQRLSNINAIYMPNNEKNILYQGITPVNVFRVIFNNYFDTSYEILPDKVYYSPYGDNFIYKNIEFQDITKIILN